MSKFLYFDIETSMNKVYTFQIGNKVSISHDQIIDERKIICICYKWEHEKKVHSLDWGKSQNDKALLKAFLKVVHEADVIVAHNGDRYDIRFIQGRLAFHNLDPLDATSIDTLKQSRKAFFINSHKLDYIGQFFQLGRKVPTGGISLWLDVMHKCPKALSKMIRYCKQDVLLLEKAYKQIRKYCPQTVHRGVLENSNAMACPACGSSHTYKHGTRIKTKIRYRRRACQDCGHFYLAERVGAVK